MRLCTWTGLLVLLILSACSGGHGSTPADDAPLDQLSSSPAVSAGGAQAGEPALHMDGADLLLGELAAVGAPPEIAAQIRSVAVAPVPAEVDPVLYEELRAELIRVLSTKRTAIPMPPAYQPATMPTGASGRTVSFTPYGMVNVIDDLYLSGSGPVYLTWSYRNRGDYDLNGMVNVSDLTPLGQYYNASSSEPRWRLAAAADGDGNGLITVSDITQIGQYFNGTIIGYQVWGTNDPGGEWSHIGNATVETNLRKTPQRPRFVIKFNTLDYEYYSIWPFDNSDDGGWWSNIATPGMGEPRKILYLENLWDAAS